MQPVSWVLDGLQLEPSFNWNGMDQVAVCTAHVLIGGRFSMQLWSAKFGCIIADNAVLC